MRKVFIVLMLSFVFLVSGNATKANQYDVGSITKYGFDTEFTSSNFGTGYAVFDKVELTNDFSWVITFSETTPSLSGGDNLTIIIGDTVTSLSGLSYQQDVVYWSYYESVGSKDLSYTIIEVDRDYDLHEAGVVSVIGDINGGDMIDFMETYAEIIYTSQKGVMDNLINHYTNQGYETGFTQGYSSGYTNGNSDGYTLGFQEAYEGTLYDDAYLEGQNDLYNNGSLAYGFDRTASFDYEIGYSNGFSNSASSSAAVFQNELHLWIVPAIALVILLGLFGTAMVRKQKGSD